MAVQACLNGSRAHSDGLAVPQTASELAADAVAVRRAGASSVHVHPRGSDGQESLDARVCDAAVAAIAKAVPGMAIGFSTAATIDPDPFARAAQIRTWRRPPDFVSVNLSELGWAGIVRAAVHSGIGVEAGLSTPAECEALADSPFRRQLVRALVEVRGGVEDARAVARLVPVGVPQLWHGYGALTWDVLAAGAAAGHDVRVGFEDVLTLPDGRPAASNAELIGAALRLITG
jgi:uncharacterized protein (DUF849 family)